MMEQEQRQKELENWGPLPQKSEKVEGKLMEDGLIHTKEGTMYFQDGRKVGGVNMDQAY